MKDIIERLFHQAGFDITKEQINKFQRFGALLLEYNEKFNLTAITDKEEIINKHFIDSMQGKEFLETANKIVDIGSGAGFPSIPLKLVCPEKEFMLLDSLNKRIGFLKVVIEDLELKEMKTEHIRIEDAGQRKHRNLYDVVLARAVAPLNTLLEYSMPLLRVGGKLIAYKGDKAEDEIKDAQRALKLLYGEISHIKEYKLAETYNRQIIVVQKLKDTPEIYPRLQNKPKKLPL